MPRFFENENVKFVSNLDSVETGAQMAKKKSKNYTFEEVDRIVKKQKKTVKLSKSKAANAVLPDEVCEIWGTVKPILNFVKGFLPKRWQTVINQFIKIIDALCA